MYHAASPLLPFYQLPSEDRFALDSHTRATVQPLNKMPSEPDQTENVAKAVTSDVGKAGRRFGEY